MAKTNGKQKEQKISTFKLKMLSALALAPEARNEESKGAYPAGRIKKFFDMFRANSQTLMMSNLLTLIFALPLLAILVFISVIGFEQFAYMLEGIKDAPYLMTGFGIGLSSGMALAEAKVISLMSYRVLFLGIGVCMPVLSFGIAGNMYICQKIVWGESFVCKKDKYGNNVPRIVTEFFRGVKAYWKQMLIVFSVYGLLFAGGANLIVEFIAGTLSGGANAGQWIGLILSVIVLLGASMTLLTLAPQVVSYNGTLNLLKKLGNSAIYAVLFAIPTLIILAFAAAPFALFAAGGFVTIILVVAMMSIGLSYICLLSCNYADYNSEKVLQELYKNSQIEAARQTRKGTEKKVKEKTVTAKPVNYKKKKK